MSISLFPSYIFLKRYFWSISHRKISFSQQGQRLSKLSRTNIQIMIKVRLPFLFLSSAKNGTLSDICHIWNSLIFQVKIQSCLGWLSSFPAFFRQTRKVNLNKSWPRPMPTPIKLLSYRCYLLIGAASSPGRSILGSE